MVAVTCCVHDWGSGSVLLLMPCFVAAARLDLLASLWGRCGFCLVASLSQRACIFTIWRWPSPLLKFIGRTRGERQACVVGTLVSNTRPFYDLLQAT